ncbi:MAG: AraC family transcriptional regulator [Cyclobacteriaceae bacterium]
MRRTLEHPAFERITPQSGDSLTVRQFSQSARNTRPFWHYHPELELVYVNGGSGKRHVGSHLSYFHDGELVLIGSNLPHQGFSDRLNGYRRETVIQMLPSFLGNDFFNTGEMTRINELFERARRGLSFNGDTKEKVGAKIEEMVSLNPFDRILKLLSILNDLALSEEYLTLNAKGFSLEIQPQDNDRINVVLNHVRENFQHPITLAEITDKVSMTEPSFCRYFKKVTGKTFTRFVNDYRLVHASKLLVEKRISILEVCYESGFTNYSHFTKQFKAFAGKSPSQYRSERTQIVE